ncbi:hypothetical protein CEE37_00735 [candidate division LCP-89 bacterium B3_LCP]|uniref:Flagellar protein FliL n=1 Tax=candidate division LCP-89 bacterium B3_LCP TaxID=2012998 RepID=A0A532V4V8_UNCL8|nr:MAG: hypothetical protein CEE37_00735 [candidate division LCP-89 bacterium B3_LCP]
MNFKALLGKPINIVMVVFAVIGVVLLSRVIVQTFVFSPPEQAVVHDGEASVHSQEREAKKEEKKKDSHGGGQGEGEEPEEGIHMIENLVVNPANSGGRRHLMVSLGLEYHELHVKEELERLDPPIRDNLITLLAGQEMGVLADIKYRERIRKSLLKAINYYIEDGRVEKLYFVRYVFQ